jgi:Fe-S-cluster-containing hydrogenase component 2
VNCGACTAVCTVDALRLNKDSILEFDNLKCIDCKLCVTACPVRAIDAVL